MSGNPGGAVATGAAGRTAALGTIAPHLFNGPRVRRARMSHVLGLRYIDCGAEFSHREVRYQCDRVTVAVAS